MKVSSVQLAFTGIETSESGQGSIEGFFRGQPTAKRQREDEASLTLTDANGAVNDTAHEDQSTTSFTCARCGKTISLPQALIGVKELHHEALTALQSEHSDYHFAQDLSKESNEALIISGPTRTSPKKKKRRKEPHGIEKFFGRA